MSVQFTDASPSVWFIDSDDEATFEASGPAAVFTVAVAGPQGPPGEGVPTGGTTGQVLTKDSATDYDTSWQDPTGGSGGIAAGTTYVDFFVRDTDIGPIAAGMSLTIPDVLALFPDAVWWIAGETTDPTGNGIYTVTGGVATKNADQPTTVGSLIYALQEKTSALTVDQNLLALFINLGGSMAVGSWAVVPNYAPNIGYGPTTSGDWDATPGSLQDALDELASRIRALEP